VVTGARDCQNRDVLGAQFDLIDDATGAVVPPGTGSQDIKFAYFNSDRFPDPRCTQTVAEQSLWIAINVPAASHAYSFRFRGRMTDADTADKVVATRKIEGVADAIVISRAGRLSK
jgi:hypothetical protein